MSNIYVDSAMNIIIVNGTVHKLVKDDNLYKSVVEKLTPEQIISLIKCEDVEHTIIEIFGEGQPCIDDDDAIYFSNKNILVQRLCTEDETIGFELYRVGDKVNISLEELRHTDKYFALHCAKIELYNKCRLGE